MKYIIWYVVHLEDLFTGSVRTRVLNDCSSDAIYRLNCVLLHRLYARLLPLRYAVFSNVSDVTCIVLYGIAYKMLFTPANIPHECREKVLAILKWRQKSFSWKVPTATCILIFNPNNACLLIKVCNFKRLMEARYIKYKVTQIFSLTPSCSIVLTLITLLKSKTFPREFV